MPSPTIETANRADDDALPMAEFLHPLSLFSMGMVAFNDHVLKSAGLFPGWLTGKLSDIFGMIFFPLFLTALVDTGLYLAVRVAALSGTSLRIDYRLSGRKLVAAVVLTGAGFTALQLSPLFVAIYARFHAMLGIHVQVTSDVTDLIALPFLGIAYLVGLRQIHR